MWLPEEDRFFETKGRMVDTIKHLLAGRVAEELKLEDISTGASNDLERATEIAREMITKYGFSEKLGPVSFGSNDEVFLGRDFSTRQNISDEVASEIDHEIRDLLESCYKETKKILNDNDEAFERVAQALLLVETIDGDQFEKLFTGEVTPEELAEEIEKENKAIERKNKKEAAESRRLEEKARKEAQEKLRQFEHDYGENYVNRDMYRELEEQKADVEEDRVGYEEYKRATAKKEDKDED